MPMKPTERRELAKVIKGKFEILRAELNTKADEYQEEALAHVDRQFEARLAKAHGVVEEFRLKVAALRTEARKAQDRLKKSGVHYKRDYREEMFLDITIYDNWTITERETERQKVRDEVYKRRAAAGLELRKLELDLYQQLSLDAVESDEARAFLGKIPEIQDVLRPVNLRALRAA